MDGNNTKQILFFIALAVAFIVALALFGLALFQFSSYSGFSKEKVYEAKMLTYQGASNTYIARLGFYTGLCESIGIDKDFLCEADEQHFRIAVPVREGYFCIDADTDLRYYEELGSQYKCQP